MPGVESLDPQASLWDFLAYELRKHRLQQGASLEAAGRLVNISASAFSNFEAGRRHPDLKRLARLDEVWETDGHFVRIATFARQGHDPNWFAEHLEYEARASALRIFEPLIVPGLLQTEDYARAVITAENDGGDVEGAVRQRMARQGILTKKNPPRLNVVLDEGVLDRPVGGPAVMRAQLVRLLEVSQMPNAVLCVVPRLGGYHPGLAGAFKVMTVEGGGDIAYTEAAEGGRLVLDGPGVHRFTLRYEGIGADALPRSTSRDVIRQAMESMA